MRTVTEALKGNFDFGWDLLNKVIDACPDDVWNKKAGGYVFWQQLYHCFGCVDIFIMPNDGKLDSGSLSLDEVFLKTHSEAKLSKDEVKAYAVKMKAKADVWIASLDDASLADKHDGFSSRRGSDVSNVGVLSIMSGHSMYHVGSCDAVMRDNGLKGVL